MSLFKCLVPVLVLLLVEGSSARPAGAYAKDYYYPPTGQQPAVMVQNGGSLVYGNGNVTSIGTYNGGSSGTLEIPSSGGRSVGNGNAAANAEATATVISETTSGSAGKIIPQNPLHVEGPQAPGVNGNGQGNGHPDGETTAATAVSQSEMNHILSKLRQRFFVPFGVTNAGGAAGLSTFGGYGPAYGSWVPWANSQSIAISNTGSSGVGGYSVGNGNAAVNAEATATANSETTSGTTGKNEAQNPLHVEGLQSPGVIGNGQGNWHPDGETTAANPFRSQPGQWIFVPFEAANGVGGAGPSTFGGHGPAYGSQVPGANSASNAVANAGSRGVGGSSVGNGNAAANAEATATANSETTSGSTADAVSNTNRQGLSGGLSRAISNANSNATGGSTSSSSKSTANGSGVKSSALSYASASAGANV